MEPVALPRSVVDYQWSWIVAETASASTPPDWSVVVYQWSNPERLDYQWSIGASA